MKPMPSLVNPALIEWKLSGYGVATASALTDIAPWQRAQDYRRAAAARMMPLDRKDLRTRLPAGEYQLSWKIDGEFTMLVYRQGEACTINPGGTVRIGLPFLTEACERLRAAGVSSALIAGELYYRHLDGSRERVHDVSRAARQPKSQEDLDNLCFAAFDIVQLDGRLTPWRDDVIASIRKLFPDDKSGPRIHAVPAAPQKVSTVEEIESYFQRWIDQAGGEGLVLRSEQTGQFKVKVRHTLDVAVIGFTESLDPQRQGQLHDLLVALMRSDGSLHILGHVGTGFSDEERRNLLSDLKDRLALSDYVESSQDHTAYQFVRPDLVIEISCLDIISQTTRGATIDRMTLQWSSQPGDTSSPGFTGRYTPLRRLPIGSLTSATYLRRRDDKHVNPTDVRLAQITALVDIPKADVDPRNITLPKSQLLRREVYTKSLKGQTLVRKLLLWQTNKQASGEFPAYVLHLTDFSPTRKTPLQREIRVSNSHEQIDSLWTEFKKDYILSGWTPT
jgi:hypothetical protein